MAENTQPQATLAAIRRQPVTTAYALLLTDHLAYAIGREGEYPSVPSLRLRLEKIETTARCRWRLPRARQWVENELADLRRKVSAEGAA